MKREVVLKYWQLMKNELNTFKKLSIQLLMYSICKLVANVMIASNLRKLKLRSHYKQCLNSFHKINELLKKLINNKSENNKITSMRNNLNVGLVIEDVDARGPTRHLWEASYQREKGM